MQTYDVKTVSIIIPIYNSEKYLKRCLLSVARQSYSSFECILVDDGSRDNSGAICDEFEKNDRRFRAFHLENGGAGNARNFGISHAVGEFVAFIDSDDFIAPDFLSNAVASVGDSELYVSGINMISQNGEMIYSPCHNGTFERNVFLESIEKSIPQICFCGPCCKLFRRSIIEENEIRFSSTLICGEDTDFNLHYIVHCKSVFTDSYTGYYYDRSNTNSLFSAFYVRHYDDVRFVYAEWVDTLSKCGISYEYKTFFVDKEYTAQIIGALHDVFRNIRIRKERRAFVKKVCEDDILSVCSYRAQPFKKRMILFFIKHKMHGMLMILFSLRYFH